MLSYLMLTGKSVNQMGRRYYLHFLQLRKQSNLQKVDTAGKHQSQMGARVP